MKSNYAIIVAAGKGKRMKMPINKQFIYIQGRPILYYSISVFSKNPLIDGIVLVCAEDEIEYCKQEIVKKYNLDKVIKIVIGGKERQDSVFNGLKVLENCDVVLIHDGVRPFVTDRIIEDGIKYSNMYGACACGIMPKDTIKIKNKEGFTYKTLKRKELFMAQTPQCFKYDLIYDCHKKLINNRIQVTDDTTAVEYFGNKVYLYEGSYDNIKITTPEDLFIAENILKMHK
ncbi:2-C-methyl-D-erythritol 4-phosphate cytidylyltransferase [Clostridium sp. BJN0013]|uniref:2-C-methyl-D-erythritol 4-phosphate cytidylyltransferase n=1 Tax=Clostridium sp. BJN0013 TaxID=3236840 RepID=UPI0034C6BF20